MFLTICCPQNVSSGSLAAASTSEQMYRPRSQLGHLWMEAQALPFTGCVTFSKSRPLAELQFPHL